MKRVFGPPEFLVLDYRETRADDLRPLQHICAQRLPENVTLESLASEVVEKTQKRRKTDESPNQMKE